MDQHQVQLVDRGFDEIGPAQRSTKMRGNTPIDVLPRDLPHVALQIQAHPTGFGNSGQGIRTDVAWIEGRVVFPKAFFMGTPLEGLTDIEEGRGFPFPGGWLIGGAMTINLLAAHAIRFKVQAKGSRLVSGLAVIAIGAALTAGVILWGSMQSGKENQLLQEWPSLRILWQLAQGLVAGSVMLAGCVMVFKRRAGVVLLHLGVLLMMYNELLVGVSAIEGQMSIREGDTGNYEPRIDFRECLRAKPPFF